MRGKIGLLSLVWLGACDGEDTDKPPVDSDTSCVDFGYCPDEICDNGEDEDDDGAIDCDDEDCWQAPACASPEDCEDGVDNDHDGRIDDDDPDCREDPIDEDGDGYSVDVDCDDQAPEVNPGAEEICEDGLDNDCDGVDEACSDPGLDYTLVLDDALQFTTILRAEIEVIGEFDVSAAEGELRYVETQTDLSAGTTETLCDATYSLTGETFSGDCNDCDFAFDVAATLEDDHGYGDCAPDPVFSFTDNGFIIDPTLGFWTEYVHSSTYGDYVYNDAFANGIGVDYTSYGYGIYPGPYWQLLASTYDGDPGDDAVAYSAPLLTWHVRDATATREGDNLYYNTCSSTVTSYAYVPYDAPSGHTSTLGCNDYYVDAWSFDLSDASRFRVTVDTIAADTAADLAFWVNDPDGCTVIWADDNFDCAYEPTDWQCPSARMVVSGNPGTYTVYVKTWGSCTAPDGLLGAYDISVSAD
ncbi:MAG: putative metal-binding motif-containing protein [Alphaproteobacteria bacterium]|nr:putative metal-binding motif-containing protein [Alphaproteobacteria bacterium]